MQMRSSEDFGFGRQTARLCPCLSAAQFRIAGENERSMIVAKRIARRPKSGTEKRLAWKALVAHFKKLRETHLRELFSEDSDRAQRMTAEFAGIYFDYSKNRITAETLKLLIKLAEACGLQERIEAMFRGEAINVTENRAVLHVALRAPKGVSIRVNGEDVVLPVHAVLEKMADFSNR